MKQRGPSAFTFLPRPDKRCSFTHAKPRGQNAFTWRELIALRSCRAEVPPSRDEGTFTLPQVRGHTSAFTLPKPREHSCAFTLLELLVVTGIIALLMALIAPAFTALKSAGDVTSAAYTIKGVLEQARTYARANHTYTWVGFFEEGASQSSTTPATAGTGRLVISIVASKDGTSIYDPNATGTNNFIDPTRLIQVTKLVKIDNIHLPLFAVGTGNGDRFDTRPTLQNDPFGVGYNGSRFGELNAAGSITAPYDTTNNGKTKFPFWYPLSAASQAQAQYSFRRTLQFNPMGECRINSTYDMRRVVEVGLLQTHGNATPAPIGGGGTSTVSFSGNVAAVQISGVGSNVKIYRR